MTSYSRDRVHRLLCHLASLRKLAVDKKAQTLGWAYRVYNTATAIQWEFVYPSAAADVVTPPYDYILARAIEDVVEASSKGMEVLRTDAGAYASAQTPITPADAMSIVIAADALLKAVDDSQWRTGMKPLEDPRCDEIVQPLQNLERWRKKRATGVPKVQSDSESPSEHAQAELNKGIGTDLVTTQSKTVAAMPDPIPAESRGMSKVMLEIDASEYESAQDRYRSPIPAHVLNNMIRSRSGIRG
ncbi:MAG: hypothetical protein WCQ77_13390 [Planctomycetota bacterium]|jgi:hypothetical protein